MKRVKEECKKRYVADFETAEDLDDETYVWAWAICDCDNLKTEFGTEIKTFIDKLFTLEDQCVVYFHNLKFDGSFILNYLLQNGYVQTLEKVNKMTDKQFKSLVSGLGSWYQVTIKNKGKIITICDSLKKLPFTVKKIAKDLKLKECKGEIDYKKHRDEGGILTEEDKDYIRRDVEIIAQAMKLMFFDKGLYKMTIGSDCMEYYKTICKNFKSIFPVLDNSIDEFVRMAYCGGICQVADGIEKINEIGSTYDYNSMYPSQLHSSSGNKFPFGEPVYFTGEYVQDDRYPLYVIHIRAIFDIKPKHIPTLQIKNDCLFRPNEFVKSSKGLPIELYMTNIDYEIFKEQYDIIAIDFIDGYKFHGGKGLFDKYINHFYKMKEEATINNDPINRQLSKLFLNNLYGKFGSSPKTSYMTFNVDNEILKRTAVADTKQSVYCAVAAFTTAYARRELVNAIQANYDNFCYCDTDSIHIRGTEAKGIKIHDSALGCWKKESEWDEALFLRQKTYAEHIDGEWDFKCAGLPAECKKNMTIKDFYIGSIIPGKLMSKQVKGGTKLIETTFEIKSI